MVSHRDENGEGRVRATYVRYITVDDERYEAMFEDPPTHLPRPSY
jgi:hypothetical protein